MLYSSQLKARQNKQVLSYHFKPLQLVFLTNIFHIQYCDGANARVNKVADALVLM